MMNTMFPTFEVEGVPLEGKTFRTDIIDHFCDVPSETFVDLGAGTGYETLALARLGAKHVVGIEGKEHIYKMGLEIFEEHAYENCSLKLFDARNAENLDTFDNIMCFGLLYHLTNPFNFLKRLRTICRKTLLIETHVAPLTTYELSDRFSTRFMNTGGIKTVFLDQIPFQGRLCVHFGDPKVTKGSLDEAWTFWLTPDSLFKALMLSGFEVSHFFHETDELTPEPVKTFGPLLGLGFERTKVFIVARPSSSEYPSYSNPSCWADLSGTIPVELPKITLKDKLAWRLDGDRFF